MPQGLEPVTPPARPIPEGHSYLEDAHPAGTGIEALLEGQEGFIIGRLANHFLRLQTDAHLLTVAPTGAGKGIGSVIPNLLDHPGSAFVVDIRGETVAKTADARRLMGQNIVVLDPYDLTKGRWGRDSYNPLDALRPDDDRRFESDVNRLTRALMFDPDGRMSNEPIWDNVTRIMINGAITFVMTARPPERRNLREVARLFTLDQNGRAEFERDLAYAIAEQGDDVYQSLELLWSYLSDSREKTKIPDNAISQANSVLDWVGRREFRETIGSSTFSFASMQEEPTTVYLVVPEQYIKGCAVWVRALMDAAIFSHDDLSQSRGLSSRQLHQAQRSLFLIDEFPAFGKLEEIESGMATVRGRGINLWLFIQNIGQLDKIYGEHGARSIIGNAAAIQAFGSNDVKELDYFSQVIGEEMFDVESVTLGVSETEGTSEATGETVTITNSESISHGTSHSIGTGTSRARGRSTSEGKSRSEGTSTTTGYGTSDTEGVSDTEGTSEGDNIGRSTGSQSGSSYSFGAGGGSGGGSSGSSSSTSFGRSFSRNRSRALSSSKTQSRNESFGRSYTQGSSLTQGTSTTDTESRNETRGTSETTTRGTSRAEGTTKTHTKSISRGRNRSVSVKPEQRRIETPRSLRIKMGGRGQLLSLRGLHPFLAPRMDFLAKDLETGEFLFPEMVVLTSIEEVARRAENPLIAEPYPGLSEILERRIVTMEDPQPGSPLSAQQASTLRKGLNGFSRAYDQHRRGLDKQLRALEDTAHTLENLSGVFGEDWLNPGELLDALEKARAPAAIETPRFKALAALPLFTDQPDEQWDCHAGWLGEVYQVPVTEAQATMGNEITYLVERARLQEEARKWVKGKIAESAAKLDDTLAECALYEVRKRHAYRAARYGTA